MSKRLIWVLWLVLTAGLVGYYGYELGFKEHKGAFLIGEGTHGHHQIEMACSTCHTDPFGGPEVLHDACLDCTLKS